MLAGCGSGLSLAWPRRAHRTSLILVPDAQNPAFSVERHPRPSSGPLAQPLLALAHRNLHRHQDAKHRVSGVLRVHLARTQGTGALPEVDGRDGALRARQAQEPVTISTSTDRGLP